MRRIGSGSVVMTGFFLLGVAWASPASATDGGDHVVISSFFGSANFPGDEGWRVESVPGSLRYTCRQPGPDDECFYTFFDAFGNAIPLSCARGKSVVVLGGTIALEPGCPFPD